MRLFTDDSDSHASCVSPHQWDVAFDTPFGNRSSDAGDIVAIETCPGTTRNTVRSLFIDEDSGLGMDTDMVNN